jgi:hypothetical protein
MLRPEVLEALPRFTCGAVVMLRPEVLEALLRFTCGAVVMLRPEVREALLRFTCGAVVMLRPEVLEALLRFIELLELLRLTDGAVDELVLRETAADWLLLAVLPPPCERLRPWAEASDALKIRHPMRARLIMIRVTEVFIIVLFYIVQQVI